MINGKQRLSLIDSETLPSILFLLIMYSVHRCEMGINYFNIE